MKLIASHYNGFKHGFFNDLIVYFIAPFRKILCQKVISTLRMEIPSSDSIPHVGIFAKIFNFKMSVSTKNQK